MDDILFDSRSELDKLPFGAVPAGARVNFGVRAAAALGVTKLWLVLTSDSDGAVSEFELSEVWRERGYARFEGGIVIKAAGLYFYHFKALAGGVARSVEKTIKGAAFTDAAPSPWQLGVYSPDYTTPDWIKTGAFYHVFVDRFCKHGERPIKDGAIFRPDWGGLPNYKPDEKGEIKNNDFFGGNLDGVIEKLPYLHELGISCIYLSPVFEAASNHKYDTADYLKIDPSFGDEELFKTLCAESEKLGIRILCDGVFNHTGSDSVYFNRDKNYGDGGAYQSKASPYYEWYSFSEYPDKYDAWWGIKTLPQMKKDSESFRNFINGEGGVLQKWMSCGAFGWRLDVADELSENFLLELRKTVKRVNPEALIIGEVWEDASNKVAYGRRRHYFDGAELDTVMNYPLKDAIIKYALTGVAEGLRETAESLCENYPKPALDCLMNVLGTHDTARILTVLGGKTYASRDERAAAVLSEEELARAKSRLFIASLLQFTLPGVPCVYYGDEAGLQGYEDPFNRRCYPWGAQDAELTDWYKQLLCARRGNASFAGGDYRTLRAENGVFSFTRTKNGDKTLILVNMGTEAVSLELTERDRLLISRKCEINNNSLRILGEGCVITERVGA